MIVTSPAAFSTVAAGTPDGRQETCLARRGMLHSECEAVDHLRVPGGVRLLLSGGPGRETAWFVVSGAAELSGPAEPSGPVGGALAPGDLVLVPPGCDLTVRAAPGTALELLRLTVLTSEAAGRLPERAPVA